MAVKNMDIRRKISNLIKTKSTKIIAGFFTFAILTLLIFTGPAQAFILGLVVDGDNEVAKGETITFTASIEIQSQDEYLPINYLTLEIGGKTCNFNIKGDVIDECKWINEIAKTSGTYGGDYGYGYGYDNDNLYGYGYGYNFDFGYGYGYGYSSGLDATTLTYNITIDTDYFSPKTYQAFLKANIGKDNKEKTFESKSQDINITLVVGEEYATEETFNVSENTTVIIIGEDSGDLTEIVIPSNIALDKEISLDFQPLVDSGNVTIANNLTLTREGVNNYTVEIPNGTIISGGDSWNGTFIIPTEKVASNFSVPGGSVDVVIELGSSEIELNFSKAVKITLGGMATKSAAWTRGTNLTEITTICDSATNHTKINPNSPRECYISNDGDLIIWTFHFTKFAAFTPTSTIIGGVSGSGGSCKTTWECSEWTSTCVNEVQTRICEKVRPECYVKELKPAESKSCEIKVLGDELTETPLELVPTEETEEQKGFFSGITGAVLGTVTSTIGIIIIIFIIGLAGVFITIRTIRKKKK